MSTVVLPLGKHKVEIQERIAAILHPRLHQPVPRFYGYARANLDQQTYPVPVQEEELQRLWRATVEDEGVQWAGVFSDRAKNSAKPLGNRTAGYALKLRLRAGDHVAMTKLDRAFRNVQEAAKQIQLWVDAGIVVHVIDLRLNTKTLAGKVVLGTLAAVAEFGHSLRRERGRAVMNTEKIKKKIQTQGTHQVCRQTRLGLSSHRGPRSQSLRGGSRRKKGHGPDR